MWLKWDETVVREELSFLKDLGMDTVLTYLHYEVFKDERYLKLTDEFLEIADQNGLKVVFSLFDVEPPSFDDFEESQRWVRPIVERYGEDERILYWILRNEINCEDYFTSESASLWVKRMVEYMRSKGTTHPITVEIALSNPSDISTLINFLPYIDYVQITFYGNPFHLNSLLKKIKSLTSKPIVLSEFGLPTDEYSEREQAEYYRKIIQTARENHIYGLFFWECFDHYANVKPYGIYTIDHQPKQVVHEWSEYWR